MSGLRKCAGRPTRTAPIKVLIFRGAGDKAFASGTDINQFRAFKTPEHAMEYEFAHRPSADDA